MELPVLSVIIPVYNVEKYLDECVNSIVNQSYKNLEIILVDDGSTDKSGAICDEWRNKDSRIKVVHKANAGSGYARNSGIEVAEGDFVAFVDSDDFIDKDMYQDLMSIAISDRSDIVYSGGFDKYLTDGSYNIVRDIQEKISVEGKDLNTFALAFVSPANKYANRTLIMSPCRAIYSTKVIPHFLSERIVASEDLPFNIEAVLNSKRITCTPKVYYKYRYNDTSLTRTFRFDKYYKYKKLRMTVNNILSSRNLSYSADYCMLVITVDTIRALYFANVKYADRKKYIAEIVSDSIWDETKIDKSGLSAGYSCLYSMLKSHSKCMLLAIAEMYYFVRKRLAH